MPKTAWKEYTDDGRRYRIRATYDWHTIGTQEPYWSVTAEIERWGGRWREDSGGCLHEDVVKHFPRLGPSIKWHLSFTKSGPMHYEANARFWLEKHYGVSKWDARDYDPVPLDAFKRQVVFGAVEGDVMPTLDGLAAWCAARQPHLIAAMHADIDPLTTEAK